MISCVCSPLKECFRCIFVIHCPAENKRDLEHSDLEIWHHIAGAIFSVLYEVKVAAVWGDGGMYIFFWNLPLKKDDWNKHCVYVCFVFFIHGHTF